MAIAPVSVPCCSPKSKLLCLSAGLVTLVIVAIASFVLGRASVKPSSLSQTLPTPTVTITTPAPDETANWKIYTNYGFSIKYPPSWIISGENIPQGYLKERGSFPIAMGNVALGNQNDDTNYIEVTIFDLIDSNHKEEFERDLNTALKKETVELSDKTYEKFTGVNLNIAPDSFKRFDFWTLKSSDGKKAAKIQVGRRPLGSTVNEEELKLILSTFNFLD